ncbi:MAG TPA: phosphatase PAP2 family protein [Caulobacteraceae bacterium]|jgi:acid phosphatase (class A)
MRAVVTAAAACAVLAGSAAAQGPRPQGYLPAGAIDSLALAPAPPPEGSAAQAADEASFRDSRKLQGSARWAQAIAEDRVIFPPAGMAHFHCALGAKVDEKNAPALTTLMSRVVMDSIAVADPVKTKYARVRPSVKDTTSPVCVPRDPRAAASGSYPSSHAVAGWAWGLILAELAPDRATALVTRGREFGENRAICGVHYPSDIDVGRLLGSAMVARLHAEPAFTADLAKAKAEVAAARASAPATGCGG